MKREKSSEEMISSELAGIADATRPELLNRWEATHGRAPPKGLSRRLLEYSAAYDVQVKATGGLKPSTKRQLANARSGDKKAAKKTVPSALKLIPGARLVREWHGQTHTVEVIDGAFCYDGQHFRSLSEIARTITGARWSGPRFFGL